jgi:hypothetical protein
VSGHPHHHWLCSLTGHKLGNLSGERGRHADIDAIPFRMPDGSRSPYSCVVEKCVRCGLEVYGASCGYVRSHSLWG